MFLDRNQLRYRGLQNADVSWTRESVKGCCTPETKAACVLPIEESAERTRDQSNGEIGR